MRKGRNKKTKLSWNRSKKINKSKTKKNYWILHKDLSAKKEKDLVQITVKQKYQKRKLVIIVQLINKIN